MASAGYRGVSKYVSTYTQQAAAEAPEQNSTKFLSIFDIFVHHEWAQKSHCGSDFLCPKKVKPTTLWPSSSGTLYYQENFPVSLSDFIIELRENLIRL